MTKFLIVGCGSIGKRHLRNLRQLGYTNLLVYRSTQNNVHEIEQEFGVTSFFEIETALAQHPDIVIITNPTSLHIPVALAAARVGAHLFIEKPISDSWEQVDELAKVVLENKLVATIAYNLRFHPGLRKVQQLLQDNEIGRVICVRAEVGSYLPDWRPDSDYRKVYSARADLGGGVVLDLSHDIDYLLWLFGQVRCVTSVIGRYGELEIAVEDTAEILLEHSNGILSSLHLDYVQRSPIRNCRIVSTKGTLIWDYYLNKVEVFSIDRNCWDSYVFDAQDRNAMYRDELQDFIKCVEEHRTPLVSLEAGIQVLKVIMAAKHAASTGKRQELV
ncbi:MAG: Gfo/Idh/MocA family oxidoreductase [Anaerolineae bacterium]|nr:Gfo/Idh/MocA family oxidoreductase [Anaerolineae bacterium]